MAGPALRIGVAAGAGDQHAELGTDAVQVAQVLREMRNPDGVLVLMDLGSAVLSAQAAVELLESEERKDVRLSSAPFVEGAVIAAVQASAGSKLEDVMPELDHALAGKEEQVEPTRRESPLTPTPGDGTGPYSEAVLEVANEHGLHARPAAELVALAGKFPDEIQITDLTSGTGPASARSLSSIALLQVRKGDQIRVRAWGATREAAVAAVVQLAKAGFGEAGTAVGACVPEKQSGFASSPGIAIGPLVYVESARPAAYSGAIGSPQEEWSKLRQALAGAKERLAADTCNAEVDKIHAAQRAALDDPVLLQRSESLVAGGQSGFAAWATVCDDIAKSYEAMSDAYLRERAADIRDIKQAVLRELSGSETFDFASLKQHAIIFTHELLASEAARCQRSQVLGVIAQRGSPTSHAAILLRSAGIPMVVGLDWIRPADAGKLAALDGSTGEAWIDPPDDLLVELRKTQRQRAELQQRALNTVAQPAITKDGIRVEVMANVASIGDGELAARNCADGIGLLRTELLLWPLREDSEADQVRAIQQALGNIAGPLVVRTLDIGGDKPWPAVQCEAEANPFLGVRGLRLTLRNPVFFHQHLRAILRAGAGRDLWIMFPMVSTNQEVKQARAFVENVHEDLAREGTPHAWPVRLGCMIEVPSAALLAETFARGLEFLSIGTNDLTQYTLAAERGNAALSELQDALHPAVLRLVHQVVHAASMMSRHVAICGEAAADPVAAAVFLALGMRSLSVAPTLVPQTKACIRGLSISELAPIGERIVQCSDAGEVRKLVSEVLPLHSEPVALAR